MRVRVLHLLLWGKPMLRVLRAAMVRHVLQVLTLDKCRSLVVLLPMLPKRRTGLAEELGESQGKGGG